MLIVLVRLYQSAVAAAVAGHQAVVQDQVPVAVANQAVAAKQEVPNPEEVPTRVLRKVHVVHLDAAKLEFEPLFSSP